MPSSTVTRLHEPARHEPLLPIAWDAARVRATIDRIVRETEAHYDDERYWVIHPRDVGSDDERTAGFATPLYHGACGVLWALRHLERSGATTLRRRYAEGLDALLERNRSALGDAAERERASFMFGDTPIQLLAHAQSPAAGRADALETLIASNVAHPARELMWGSPGTMLAALFLHESTGDERWARQFRATAARLWSELEWSERFDCAFWTQDLYGRRSTYLDAVHGFAATALPLIRGRSLLAADDWTAWQRCIVQTVTRTVVRSGTHANWPPELESARAQPWLLQFCHGAPGFVICLASMPGDELDELLLAAGQTVWDAGPLVKGSNLCHGTGGNGYAFLGLHRRTGDERWLERARAFAMHGIVQTESEAARYGQLRYSLWTGDPGFAIFLHDCLQAQCRFPTLDTY